MARLSLETQSIEFDHIANARDLGGIEVGDGRHVRRGLLLRGGRLSKASDKDVAALRDKYHLAYIFDFRTDSEVKRAPDRDVPGAEYVWMPTIDQKTDTLLQPHLPPEAYHDLARYFVLHSSDPDVKRVAHDMYPDLVSNEYTQLQYSSFLQMVSNVENGAVFLHCSQGKDRTGLGAAFILAALGASRETIMEEFDLSNVYYEQEMEDAFRTLRDAGVEIGQDQEDAVHAFIGVSLFDFVRALDMIDRDYGSLDKYLHEILFLSDDDIKRLRDRLLE